MNAAAWDFSRAVCPKSGRGQGHDYVPLAPELKAGGLWASLFEGLCQWFMVRDTLRAWSEEEPSTSLSLQG